MLRMDKMMTRLNRFDRRPLLLFITALVVSACQSPTFKPEVSGPGAVSSRGGVVYSIPPENPVMKMKLVSLGAKQDSTLQLRLYFVLKGPPAGEYLDPREQLLYLPDSGTPIEVTKVHASDRDRPIVKLSDRTKQTVELIYPLPSGSHKYPYVEVRWKIHYKQDGQERVMAQRERFDIQQKNPQASVGSTGGDPDFPFEDFESFPGDSPWVSPGWLWW